MSKIQKDIFMEVICSDKIWHTFLKFGKNVATKKNEVQKGFN